MARFKNSNRQAAQEMAYTASRKSRSAENRETRQGYFQRIGFDFAMI